ncbi:hypothetical protein CLAFUW4_13674 [Fulvia fulva]|uniref:Uncharacterized protein n=1 Tax=Passalora fulva TaxID=5499 RepID=A0A9Q8PL48_PASFU|nr:uncharacterized protein CLAFUR5_13523 [Fulvia fulva]KAK4610219.1 hypothetical protein CLAFUR4_13677 [Fulvia fulva]KAK4611221.1 hypothetical protein CLAFUR0_13681 [Fulvia fulva]UJO24412.1 hypothetical protein CLAFUR5_13523 [Fulvia fulva]WPV21986.1 hypothetical protein CLAFUW4_13674 [Fulvia fulva]WPV37173.1 hypothetical protein CLAFUW7_13682 [Fulvia fulva]
MPPHHPPSDNEVIRELEEDELHRHLRQLRALGRDPWAPIVPRMGPSERQPQQAPPSQPMSATQEISMPPSATTPAQAATTPQAAPTASRYQYWTLGRELGRSISTVYMQNESELAFENDAPTCAEWSICRAAQRQGALAGLGGR